MGMSVRITGLRPPDERWERMRDVWEACRVAGVPLPAEVDHFFDHKDPHPKGVEVLLGDLIESGALRTGGNEVVAWFDLDVTKLPDGVTKLRIYDDW